MSKKSNSRDRESEMTEATEDPSSRFASLKSSIGNFFGDEAFDRRLDQGVDFLAANGFAGEQLKHLFSLTSRRQKLAYIASVTSCTVAVTLFSRGLMGRTLKRVPFLRWGRA